MKKEHSLGLIVLLASLPVLAQFEVQWNTIDSGGNTVASAGGGFEVAGTIGQPDAASSPTLIGGSFEVTGGFWPVANVCYCLGDVNHDGKKNGRDVQYLVNCLLAAGDCSCADIDQANGVTIADVGTFVTDLLAGPSCH